MSILEKTVWISLETNNFSYLEELNYIIPRRKDKWGKFTAPRGTKIEVKVEDLHCGSTVKLTKVCDICGNKSKPLKFLLIMKHRTDGKDYCRSCVQQNKPVSIGNSIAYMYPDLMEEWHPTKNVKKPQSISCGSKILFWWTCKNNPDHIYKMSPKQKIRNGVCTHCPRNMGTRSSKDNCVALFPHLVGEWHDEKNGDFTVYNVSSRSGRKIWWKCSNIDCMHEWETVVYARTRNKGTGCPRCNDSKGEKIVEKYLNDKNFNFISQYSFNDLKGIGKRILKFDFGVINKNNELLCLIEYDGEFHYMDIYEGLESNKAHDKLKNEYCKLNNIPLIRIPYWEFGNIEKILYMELNSLSNGVRNKLASFL